MTGSNFEKNLNNPYEKIVQSKKNLFMLPSSTYGKNVEEVTRLMKLWIQDVPMKSILPKAVHVMSMLHL